MKLYTGDDDPNFPFSAFFQFWGLLFFPLTFPVTLHGLNFEITTKGMSYPIVRYHGPIKSMNLVTYYPDNVLTTIDDYQQCFFIPSAQFFSPGSSDFPLTDDLALKTSLRTSEDQKLSRYQRVSAYIRSPLIY